MTSTRDLNIPGDGTTDVAPLLRNVLVPGMKIEFEPGVYMFGSQVELPAGAELRGCGIGSQLSPLNSFSPRTHLTNALMSTVPGSSGIIVESLFFDGLTVGYGATTTRICGLVMRRTTGFVVRNVVSGQWSGYAQWASGDGPSGQETNYGSGRYEDCISYDSDVLFEQSRISNVELWRCEGHDGRRLIPIEAAFHQLSGATDISHWDCSFKGKAGGGVNAVANGLDLANIAYRRHRVEMTSPNTALLSGPNPPDPARSIGLIIEDSYFSSPMANCAALIEVNLTCKRTTFRGYHVGIGLGTNTVATFEDVDAGSDNYPHAAYTQPLYCDSNSVATFTRGALRSRGVNPRPYAKAAGATLTLSPQTDIVTVQKAP